MSAPWEVSFATWNQTTIYYSEVGVPATDHRKYRRRRVPPHIVPSEKHHVCDHISTFNQHCSIQSTTTAKQPDRTHPSQEKHADQVDVSSLGCKVQHRHPSTRDRTNVRSVADQEGRKVERAGVTGDQESGVSLYQEQTVSKKGQGLRWICHYLLETLYLRIFSRPPTA